MAGGEPRTPPGTPKKAAGGGDKLGPTVDNRHTRNHGGVVTGNNYGYNSIIGISLRLHFFPRIVTERIRNH